MDGFYGNKEVSGLLPIDRFARWLTGEGGAFPRIEGPPEYWVRSLADAEHIFSSPRHSRYVANGRMSFRGQNSDYLYRRGVSNPVASMPSGEERTILPSAWRSSQNGRMSKRRGQGRGGNSILTTIFAEPLIFHGIPGWQNLAERNYKRYGPHSIGDLEDFPDEESESTSSVT